MSIGNHKPLVDLAEIETVDNVVLFISDSTRIEAVPDEIWKIGMRLPMIASSTFTAPSLPSILSGQYPSTHQVWSFNDRLPETPALISQDNVGFRADTIWTHLEPESKPPRRMARTTATDRVENLTSPFVYVEHHKGGHDPYGYSFEECASTGEFFESKVDSLDEIPKLYQRSVDKACQRFFELVDHLKARNILENTLVVFTSDHGEVLGESEYGGAIGHEQPMVPELVKVPTVLLGAGLPGGATLSGQYSGTDIAPTALGAMNETVPSSCDGIDLWSHVPDREYVRSEVWRTKQLDRIEHTFTKYNAASLWDRDGGRVYHRASTVERLAYAAYSQWIAKHGAHLVRKNLTYSDVRGLLSTYIPQTLEYGSPRFSVEDGREALPDPFQAREMDSEDAIPKEQLEQLGYL
jgi:hypothetical protein